MDIKSNDLDAIFAQPGQPTVEAKKPPASYAGVAASYTESCRKCGGSGRFTSYSGRVLGDCFACKGKGSNSFATSPEARAASRDRAAVKRVEKAHAVVESANSFRATYPAMTAWLEQAAKRNASRGGSFTFPADLLDKLNQYGSLTDAQFEAVCKLMAKDAERKAQWEAERVAKEAAAPVADTAGVDRLKAAFDAAAAYVEANGLKRKSPKITIGDMIIYPAKATSANPGALYVKLPADDTYLGKIANGRFSASRDCSAERQTQILAFVADPAEAAKVYGQTTGTCCICNATLRSEWKLRGIGPICAEKFGW
jgi:hypothetical protein